MESAVGIDLNKSLINISIWVMPNYTFNLVNFTQLLFYIDQFDYF